jgi:hypothetical protein
MTRLYPSSGGVAYTPATIRGAWEKTTGHVVSGMSATKDLPGLDGPILSVASAETIGTTDYDVLLLRSVSSPLAANCNFSGTLNVMLAVQESNTDADMAYYVHIFVTQGDTDNLRGTLLANYNDLNTNEWGTTALGKALSAAASLTRRFCSWRVTVSSSRLAIAHAIRRPAAVPERFITAGNGSDLASGGTATSGIGYIDFSDTFTLVDNPALRVSQVAVEALRRPNAAEFVS